MKEKEKYFTFREILKLNLIIILVIFFFVLLILRKNPDICEWWTINISRNYENIMGKFASFFPFSLFEVWVISLILASLTLLGYSLVHFIHHRPKSAIKNLTLITLLLTFTITTYHATFGLGYGRKEVDISLYEEKVDINEYDEIIEYFIKDFNYCASTLKYENSGNVISPYSFDQLNDVMKVEYKKFDSNYLNPYTPNVKKMYLTSFLYSELGITGLFFSPSGDANINFMIPNYYLPFVMAHELAHAKGAMREDDANLISMYLNLTSDIPFLRYSAYMWGFTSILNLAKYMGDKEAYNKYYESLDVNIRNDWKYSRSFWNKHNLFEEIGTFINNIYLLFNGTGGVNDYDDNFGTGTGTVVDGDGNIVEIPIITTYSNYQKLYFKLYFK